MFRPVFVASLLSVMVLGISEPAAALQTQRASVAHAINPLDVQHCSVYPIAIYVSTVANAQPGDSLGDIYNGYGYGQFGWLRWPARASANNEEYLIESLNNPGLAATDFEDACEAGDFSLNAGDCVWSNSIVSNSSGVREALTALEGQDIRVPVWDTTIGAGINAYYHVAGFAIIRITDFDLTGGQSHISAQFVRWDGDTCLEVADLSIAKSASPGAVSPGQTLTYTLAFSNMGAGPATGVVISDALPLVLTGTHFTSAGALITPTSGVTYAWQVQDLAPNEGGVITVTGQVRPDLAGVYIFTNSAAITGTNAESDTGNNVGTAQTWVWVPPLPVILSLNGTTFEVNTDILVRLEQHLPDGYYDIYLGSFAICTNVCTNRFGMGEYNCLIPPDFAPGTYELTSILTGGSTKVAGGVFIAIVKPIYLPLIFKLG